MNDQQQAAADSPHMFGPGRIAFCAASTPLATDALNRLVARYGDCPLAQAAVAVALGGDGSMLETLHRVLERRIPVYGMNCGSVGFLMNTFDEEDLPGRLARAQATVLHPLRMRAVISSCVVTHPPSSSGWFTIWIERPSVVSTTHPKQAP